MRPSYLYKNYIDNIKFLTGFISNKAFIGPHTVMFDIEDECDLFCDMCFYHSPYLEDKFESEFTRLDYNTVKSTISLLNTMGVRKITICGKGEPFLHPDILKIIEFIKSKDFYLSVFTNGTHINDTILRKLFDYKVDQMIFSLHASNDETYLKVHPSVGNNVFEKIENRLRLIKRYKEYSKTNIPYIKIVNVIFEYNYKDIKGMIEFAEEYADEILFKPVILYKEQEDLRLRKNNIKEIFDNFKLDNGFKIKNNIRDFLSYMSSYYNYNATVSDKKRAARKCFIPVYQSVIMTNGDVVVCPYNQKVMGNIKKDNFYSIWYSERYKDFRRNTDCINCKGKAVYPYLRKCQKIFKLL